jgi:hypothetical protein
MPTDQTVQQRRRARLELLIAEFGIADDCEALKMFDGTGRDPRYALMETDDRGINGGPWWEIGPDIADLLEVSAGQESAGDWPAETVFDLDSDVCWEVSLTYRLGTEHTVELSRDDEAGA